MKITDGKIEIHPSEIIDSLSEEDKKSLIKELCISSDVINWVFDYICGDDEDGWWSSENSRQREQLLRRVEKTHLNKVTRYDWNLLEQAANSLKHVISENHIYWNLYHHPDRNTLTIDKFLEKFGENQYTTKLADDKIEEIVNIVKEAVKEKE